MAEKRRRGRPRLRNLARIVLFQGEFQVWKKESNQQAVPGFKTKTRAAAMREAKRHGLDAELYGGAKHTLRVA